MSHPTDRPKRFIAWGKYEHGRWVRVGKWVGLGNSLPQAFAAVLVGHIRGRR
jgi:hypothetical protein